ncbi:MAG: hypothetical protein JWP01_3585 [Myxococcales bacterium]|nr:hypothetical protein [Myxococcales bacterium]
MFKPSRIAVTPSPVRIRRRARAWMILLALAPGCVTEPDSEVVEESETEFELSIGPGQLSLSVGETVQLNAAVSSPSGARLYTLGYKTTNPQVMTVSGSGVVKAVAAGTARIDVTATLLDTGGVATASVTVVVGGGVSSARDPLKQPFASTSIWNMPIGSGAVFAPANIDPTPESNPWSMMPLSDADQIVLRPTAPLTDIRYSSAGWSGNSRCGATNSTVLARVPMPADFVVADASGNNSTAFLLADRRTLVQTQPLARCTAGGIATSLVKMPNVDLYGDGITGSHGGSGMSAIGGTIRLGELRPGQLGPQHALKLVIYMKEAYKCATRAACFRWPANTADSYSVGWYGTGASNQNVTNTAMKMGALLAIPGTVDIAALGLETAPARQLAWTLQNYGGYVVDDAYAPQFGFATENGPDGSFVSQFKADYGFDFVQRVTGNHAFMRDVQRLAVALRVVNNNSPTSIGGGGTPRRPLAAPLVAP